MREHITSRLVKSEDLNHHGTLFAGRTAEWFVESAFVAAASSVRDPRRVVCLNVHGLIFKSPVNKGDIVNFSSRVVHFGKTSIVTYVKMETEIADTKPVEGFITFIHVDLEGKKTPHGLSIDESTSPAEIEAREKFKEFK